MDFEQPKILITGAAGFIGSHLLDFLEGEGVSVMGVDNYSLGTYEHKHIHKIDLVKEPHLIRALIGFFKPDVIFHLAAWAHEGLSQFCPIRITENNYNAYLNVLVPAINFGVRKVVVCSSMSVYGEQEAPFDESYERKPTDIYAIAKTAMEKATEIMADVHGFKYSIVRPHNVYGPRQNIYDPYRNVVGVFMNRIMNGKPPVIYGDGEQTRAFTYIDDIIPAMAKLGFTGDGEIFNVGPTKEYSINELADNVLAAFESDLKPIHLPDRPREVKHARCTSDKAERMLGYVSKTDLIEGITRMAEWAKTQGPKDFKYLDYLEIENDKTPTTWSKKEM